MTRMMEEDGDCQRNSVSLRQNASPEGNIIDVRNLPDSATALPTVSNMNVNKSKVHIGSKFVSITQNVHSTEVVKGRFLGLELEQSINPRRLRSGVAVFVCWALLVMCALTIYLIYVSTKQTRMNLELHEDWYLRRADWQALPAYDANFLSLPLKYTIVGHTASKKCTDKYQCIAFMRSIQRYHFDQGFADIGPNFLIGGDGYIFEGRGANVIGAMIPVWNKKMISIMFIGDYTKDKPEKLQFDHLAMLLDKLVEQQVLMPDYILSSHCQISTDIVTPGPNIVHQLKNFSHWDPTNADSCLPI